MIIDSIGVCVDLSYFKMLFEKGVIFNDATVMVPRADWWEGI